MFAEGFHQERIPLVPGVEADRLAEQARRNADAGSIVSHGVNSMRA
jgi:hypothetical protein